MTTTPPHGTAPGRVTPDKAPERISGMFDAIAPRYDFLNHLLSAGIDRRWRTRAIASLQLTGRETLLDVCTGTADIAMAARAESGPASVGAGTAARVIGVDFSGGMLELGVRKVHAAGQRSRIVLVRGDAMNLPVRSSSVDAATVAFGIRNVQRPEPACEEMARALRPGGRLAILEFAIPTIPGLGALYRWYFANVLPRIGRLVSGHTGAYSYLPNSVGAFPPPAEFMTMLRQSGFDDVRGDPLTFGIVYLYTARRRA
jgi:demethylmenaquinone methyltransferase/2-methoxy-6-polyprenyl-1,4-benzoquinol methylase